MPAPATPLEPIEVVYTSSLDESAPAPAAPADTLTRADVLRAARSLASQVTGLCAIVERATLDAAPGAAAPRPLFLKAWRAWSGALLGDVARLERTDIVKPQEEAAKVAQHAARLKELRAGIAAELQLTPAPPAPAASAPPPKKSFPWYVWMPLGFGATAGAYMGARWLIREVFSSLAETGSREPAHEER